MNRLLLICVMVFIYYNKPSDESFLQKFLFPYGVQTIGKFFIHTNTNIRDFMFFKIAYLHTNTDNIIFVGILNNWISIHDIENNTISI